MSMTLSGKLTPANKQVLSNGETMQRIYVSLKFGSLFSDESSKGLEHINWDAAQKLGSLHMGVQFNDNDLTLSGRSNSHAWSGEQGVLAFMESLGEALKIPSMKELHLRGSFHLSVLPVQESPWEDETASASNYRVNVKPDGTLTYQKLIRQWGEEVTPLISS